MLFRIFTTLIIILNLISCSKNEKIEYDNLKEVEDPIEIYKEGLEAFNTNDFLYASEKFNEAELIFDSPKSAAKSAIMSAYSLYAINLYEQAEENLNRYLKNYPGDRNVVYAHYLLAIIHFEQIGDEKYDLKPLLRTQEKVDFFLDNYPDTEYAIDLKFKKSLLKNQFAAKELYIAKYYISVQKWVAAINRLKTIVEKYDETIFIEEALHRLVEIHYYLGLDEEAKRYAKILGYNYNSGEWFKQSYKIINNDYDYNDKINEDKKKDNDNFIKKIIKIIK